MPVLSNLLPDYLTERERRAILGRLADLQSLDDLIRQPGAMRPQDPPPSLQAMAAREDQPS